MKPLIFSSFVALAVIGVLMASCDRHRAIVDPNPDPIDLVPIDPDPDVAALQKKFDVYTNTIKSMPPQELAQALAADSENGREPFNSFPYEWVLATKSLAAAQLSLDADRPGRRALLGILALRHIDLDAYQRLGAAFRVATLVDALANTKYFNIWGIPHLYWEDAAVALIAEGPAARSALTALLTNKRAAPVYGSEGADDYLQYRYRVCDYAWVMLDPSRAAAGKIPVDPADRDRLIELELGRRR